jgi:hypothetical protein
LQHLPEKAPGGRKKDRHSPAFSMLYERFT